MTGASKRKGDRAEVQAADLLSVLFAGEGVRRLLGAGRHDDVGDLDGIPRWVVQVAWWPHDTLRAVLVKPAEASEQADRAGKPHGVAMIRLVGGQFVMCMTPDEWVKMVTENERLRADLATNLRASGSVGTLHAGGSVRAGGFAVANPTPDGA